MKRIFGFSAVLWLLVVAFCIAVIAFARSMPVTALANGLDRCNGAPCYLGIVPGQTRWEEAKALLAGQNSEFRPGEIAVTTATADVLLTPSRDGRTVDNILVRDSGLRLGSLIALFGTPCHARIYPRAVVSYGGGITTFFAPFITAAVYLPPGSDLDNPILGQDAWVPYLWITSRANVCQMGRLLIRGELDRPWAGFAALRRYVR